MNFVFSTSDALRRGKKVGAFLLFATSIVAPLFASAERPTRTTEFNPSSSFYNPNSSISFVCPSDLTLGFSGNSCSATVNFPMPQANSSGCTGGATVKVSSILGAGNGPFYGIAAGTYQIDCQAFNACGDTVFCSFKITVRDSKKPKLVLKSGLHGNITPDGTVRFFARQFNQNSSDECTDAAFLKFSFSTNPDDSLRTFNCSDLGENPLQVFVFDAVGNKTSGIATVTIMDGMGYCSATGLKGAVKTPAGKTVEEVQVKISGAGFSETVLTAADGVFDFDNLKIGGGFVIEPFKNDNPMNGVNTFDLKLINDHILGKKLFDSPFKIIAADVNRSEKVTTADVVALRKMILGETSEFPGNTSWRFVAENHVFQNVMNPFQPAFPEKINVPELKYGAADQNFVAVKTGDLNGSAVAGFDQSGSGESRSENYPNFSLIIENHQFTAGEVFEVDLKIGDQNFAPDAFQFTLNTDMEQLEMLAAAPGNLSGMGFENVGLSHAADGLMTLAWSKSDYPHQPGDNIIHAKFRAKRAGNLADALTVTGQLTDALAFDNEGKMYAVELKFREQNQSVGGVELFQNAPNPFIEMTLLRFSLPEPGEATVHIFDMNGAVVFEKSATYEAGNHQFMLTRSDIGEAGIYSFQIKTDYGFATRKLVMF